MFRIAPGGAITEILDASGDGEHALGNPFELAVDAVGNVYVTDWSTESVFHVAPDGTVHRILDPTGDGQGNTLGDPSDVATDGTRVFVSGFSSNNVFRIGAPVGVPALPESALPGLVSAVLASGWWAARRRARARSLRRDARCARWDQPPKFIVCAMTAKPSVAARRFPTAA